MRFEHSKIVIIGQSELHDIQLAQWIFEHLESSVIDTIERLQLPLWIFAEIFRECRRLEDTFSAEVERRLQDQNYMTTKLAEYERKFR